MTNFDFSVFSFDLLRSFVSSGLVFSVQLTLIAMAGGILIGTLLALMRLSGSKLLEIPARIYVDGLRSIPLVMVILWVYLLIPLFLGKPIGKELSAMVTFTIFEAAYYSEIMRAGIQSISRGQVNAGQAIGLTYAACCGRPAHADHRAVPGHLAGLRDRRLRPAARLRDPGQELRAHGRDLPGRRRRLLRHLLLSLCGGQATAEEDRHRPLKGTPSWPT
jgi:His/Glu/Gln/Arg/opine family amino acid ABC transporter permease subunit